jgi:hypothetical protein
MINETNYYDLNNKGLSQSKIKDYIICPNMCYRKNISGELEKVEKKAWDIGKAIDSILTGEDSISDYMVLEAPKDIPEEKRKTYFMTNAGKAYKQELVDSGKKLITEADYDLIIEVANAVEITDAWKQIKKEFTFQEIISVEQDLGKNFDCLVGKPDAYRINKDGVCDLLDVKTTVALPVNLLTGRVNKRKYLYSALDLGYFIQMWFYSYLLRLKYPEITSFRYFHLAVEKKEPFRVELFQIPNYSVIKYEPFLLDTIEKIAKDDKYQKRDVSFEDAELLVFDDQEENDDF